MVEAVVVWTIIYCKNNQKKEEEIFLICLKGHERYQLGDDFCRVIQKRMQSKERSLAFDSTFTQYWFIKCCLETEQTFLLAHADKEAKGTHSKGKSELQNSQITASSQKLRVKELGKYTFIFSLKPQKGYSRGARQEKKQTSPQGKKKI